MSSKPAELKTKPRLSRYWLLQRGEKKQFLSSEFTKESKVNWTTDILKARRFRTAEFANSISGKYLEGEGVPFPLLAE
jgi:hypothetical protein